MPNCALGGGPFPTGKKLRFHHHATQSFFSGPAGLAEVLPCLALPCSVESEFLAALCLTSKVPPVPRCNKNQARNILSHLLRLPRLPPAPLPSSSSCTPGGAANPRPAASRGKIQLSSQPASPDGASSSSSSPCLRWSFFWGSSPNAACSSSSLAAL